MNSDVEPGTNEPPAAPRGQRHPAAVLHDAGVAGRGIARDLVDRVGSAGLTEVVFWLVMVLAVGGTLVVVALAPGTLR